MSDKRLADYYATRVSRRWEACYACLRDGFRLTDPDLLMAICWQASGIEQLLADYRRSIGLSALPSDFSIYFREKISCYLYASRAVSDLQFVWGLRRLCFGDAESSFGGLERKLRLAVRRWRFSVA
jgi:hypothetical protein